MNNKLRFTIIFFIFICGSIAIPPWYSEWKADFSTYQFDDGQGALCQLIKNEQEAAALTQNVIEYEPFKLEDYVVHKTRSGDVKYAPYVKYKIKVDGIYFVLGKIFDDKYEAFLNNQPVNSNKEGVFVTSGNKEQLVSVEVNRND